MSRKNEEAYKAWVREVEAELADEQKAHFQALVTSEAGQKVFSGHLREKDYYGKLNEFDQEKKRLESEKNQLYSWYEQEAPKNQRLLSEKEKLERDLKAYKRQMAEAGLLEDDFMSPPSDTIRSGVSKEELEAVKAENERRLQMFDRALPHLLGDLADVTYRTLKEGYKVSPKDVIKYSVENGVDPNRAFDILTADERQERERKQQNEAITKAKEEGRREALSKYPNPDHIRPSGPNIVDTLREAKPGDSRSRVNEAVAEFLAGA